MVHRNFIRKQFCIYIKIILVASFVVYFLSVIVSFIPNGNRERNGQQSKKILHSASMKLAKHENKAISNYESSFLGRWTSLAKDIFSKNADLNVNTELQGKLNVHRWYSICGNTVDNLRRHILFPKHPKLRTTISLLRMRTTLRDFGQRIFGYIHPQLSGTYQFAVSSDDFSEVWLSNDATPNNTDLICQVGGMHKGVYIMGSTRPGQFDKYLSQISQYIYLEGNQKYYIEILHKQGDGQGHLHVAWKMPGWKYFTIVTKEFLSLFTKEEQGHTSVNSEDQLFSDEMVLKHHKHVRSKYYTSGGYRNFTKLTRAEAIPLLRHPPKKLPVCTKKERQFPLKLKRYQGIRYTHIPSVFPTDGSDLVIQICQSAKSPAECKGNPLLEEEKAHLIARRYFNAAFSKNFSLISVIRVEDVLEKHTKDQRYFVELEVLDNTDNKKWRIAKHVVEKSVTGNLCYPVESSWEPDVTVYLIITVKNQGVWIRHFIDNILDIQDATGDENIHPIIVDFGSRDSDLNTYLKRSRLKHYSVIRKTGHFYKTAAINEAADLVKNENSIIFLLDLHLDLPVNLIQTVRKHTIQGDMAFVPLLTRLMCGSSPDFPTGHWEEQGYGLFAIYKSDWSRFGGMNVKEFSDHWGGEDWEMIDRVIAKSIIVHKLKMPGLFHFFHNRRGMWDKAV